VRLLGDLNLERAFEHVDELHLARERVELVAGPRARRHLGLDRLEPLLVARGEQVILGREGGIHGHALVPADERGRGLTLEDVAQAHAQRVADAGDRGERRRGTVTLQLADETLRQPCGRRELLDRQSALAPQRANARADLGRVVPGGKRRRPRHEADHTQV
jgi:hypothetical protein